jgi:hypothetical protein
LQGAAEINAHLINLRNKSANQPLNRVRAIFIGYGDAGKTSVIRVLHGEPVQAAEPMTPGIDIREWHVPDTDIRAHFWDFGGQVMVHATHQLFLRESCLYVLVISDRIETNATEQAEYWLEHVNSFSKGAPVMIVGNKCDQALLNLEMASLRGKYPNIVDYYPLSCTKATGAEQSRFATFRQDFCQQLQKVGTHQMLFTKEQAALLQDLRQRTLRDTFLSRAAYLQLCQTHRVLDDGVQNHAWLLDILDRLGVIIHFKRLPFQDGYVLNPRWLTYGVYALMYAKEPRLTSHAVAALLSREEVRDEAGNVLTYPPEKCGLIMEAMREFKLCYSLPNQTGNLIIPALLPADAPPFVFDKANALAFAFAFKGFLPRHVLPELIVNQHAHIQQQGAQQVVWQHGVLLAPTRWDAQALLQVDYHARTLSIWITGSAARDYLMLLRDDIHEILDRISIKFDELITLPMSTCINPDRLRLMVAEQADFRQILALNGLRRTEYVSASGAIYDVDKILQRFVPDAARGTITHHHHYGDHTQIIQSPEATVSSNTTTITNSTIHGNVISAEKIENSFNQLAASPAPDEVKQLLDKLLKEIQALHQIATDPQKAEVGKMLEEANTIIEETARPEPRKRWYQASLGGIVDAAQKVGVIGQSVLDTVQLLGPLLGS